MPAPEDYNKDPRLEQLAELKQQLEAANKVVASLTPRSAQKGTLLRRSRTHKRAHGRTPAVSWCRPREGLNTFWHLKRKRRGYRVAARHPPTGR